MQGHAVRCSFWFPRRPFAWRNYAARRGIAHLSRRTLDMGPAVSGIDSQVQSDELRTPRKPSLYPSLYQINTRVLLTQLSRQFGKRATLDDIPDAELDRLAG